MFEVNVKGDQKLRFTVYDVKTIEVPYKKVEFLMYFRTREQWVWENADNYEPYNNLMMRTTEQMYYAVGNDDRYATDITKPIRDFKEETDGHAN